MIEQTTKTSSNPFFHSKYADLDAVWKMCRKPLTDNGLALVQTTTVIEGRTYLETTLYHTSGQHITGRYPITPMKQVQGQGWPPYEDPQSIGSAITYARRYAMSAIPGISADEDDDAEKAMGRSVRKESPQGRPQAARPATPEASAPSTTPSTPQTPLPKASQEFKTAGAVWEAIEEEARNRGMKPEDAVLGVQQVLGPLGEHMKAGGTREQYYDMAAAWLQEA